MNALLISTLVGISAGIAPPVVFEQFTSPPPQILTGEATPPGRPPYSAAALRSGWEYTYLEPQARIEPGGRAAMRTRLHLRFGDDGTYQFFYSARWSQSGATNPLGDREANAVDVTEAGKFAVSGDILLLEPSRTDITRKIKGAVVAQQTIENDRRVYLVRTEQMRLHIAGHCATYQIEPICKEGRDVWYQLSATPVEPRSRRDSAPVPNAPD